MGEGQGRGRYPPPTPGRMTPPIRTVEKEWGDRGGPMPGMRPTMGGPGIQPQQPKGGGTMGIIMPIYTIGIIIFFVYTTMKIMFKNKNPEEEEEEAHHDRGLSDNNKYDEEYYNNYIKQFSKTNSKLSPPSYQSRVEELIAPDIQRKRAQDINQIIDEPLIEDEHEEPSEDIEPLELNIGVQRNKSKVIPNKNVKNLKPTQEPTEDSQTQEEEKSTANVDPRDLEIILLRARLEQTEKAMERIVAQMGLVTSRLAPQVMAHDVSGGTVNHQQPSPPINSCEDINSQAECKCEQTPEEVTMEDDLDDDVGLEEDYKNINDIREICDSEYNCTEEDYINYEYDRSDSE